MNLTIVNDTSIGRGALPQRRELSGPRAHPRALWSTAIIERPGPGMRALAAQNDDVAIEFLDRASRAEDFILPLLCALELDDTASHEAVFETMATRCYRADPRDLFHHLAAGCATPGGAESPRAASAKPLLQALIENNARHDRLMRAINDCFARAQTRNATAITPFLKTTAALLDAGADVFDAARAYTSGGRHDWRHASNVFLKRLGCLRRRRNVHGFR